MARLEKPSDLEGWRDYARRLEARASRKISKIRQGAYAPSVLRPLKEVTHGAGGVDIARTALDPRKGTSLVGRMTKAQVEAHAHRLEEFMAPNVSYYPSRSGEPISAKSMLRYVYAQKRSNEHAREFYQRVGGTEIPWRGSKPFSEVFNIRQPYAHKGDDARMYTEREPYKVHTFTNERAVKILTDREREVSTTRADKKMVEGIRTNIRKLTEGLGNPSLKALADLPDDLLRVLWTVDDEFIAGLTFRYEGNKEFDSDRNSPDDVFTAQSDEPFNGKDAVGYAKTMQVRPIR
jgi:hypothetical protein